MTCPNCGHRVRDGAKFCDECGIVLPDSAATSASPEPAQPPPAPRRLEAPNRNRAPLSGTAPAADADMLPPPVDMTRVRRIFVLVAIILVAVLCFCCALAVGTYLYLAQTPASMPFP